jgi:hypothetical protein
LGDLGTDGKIIVKWVLRKGGHLVLVTIVMNLQRKITEIKDFP